MYQSNSVNQCAEVVAALRVPNAMFSVNHGVVMAYTPGKQPVAVAQATDDFEHVIRRLYEYYTGETPTGA